MRSCWYCLVASCLLAVCPCLLGQWTEKELDVKYEDVGPQMVRLSWVSAPIERCGDIIRYSVFRGRTAGFDATADNQIATGLIGTSFVAREPKLKVTFYYRVIATRKPGLCNPPTLKTGEILVYPLDLRRDYEVTVGDRSETCNAISTTQLKCRTLPSFHGVIASQGEHDFLLGCLTTDFDTGNWTCVNLTPATYRIDVHSQTVTVLDSGMAKMNTETGKELAPITPVFSILALVK
jgi:hypothetical protein